MRLVERRRYALADRLVHFGMQPVDQRAQIAPMAQRRGDPQAQLMRSGDFSQGGRRWHHAFFRTLDLPEALCIGREDRVLGWWSKSDICVPQMSD
jgi:hypothetical protein